MMHYGWNDGAWGIVWMILSWAIIAVIVVLVVRALSTGSDRSSRSADPRTILDERFARGEISEDEYRERRRVLDEPPR